MNLSRSVTISGAAPPSLLPPAGPHRHQHQASIWSRWRTILLLRIINYLGLEDSPPSFALFEIREYSNDWDSNWTALFPDDWEPLDRKCRSWDSISGFWTPIFWPDRWDHKRGKLDLHHRHYCNTSDRTGKKNCKRGKIWFSIFSCFFPFFPV